MRQVAGGAGVVTSRDDRDDPRSGVGSLTEHCLHFRRCYSDTGQTRHDAGEWLGRADSGRINDLDTETVMTFVLDNLTRIFLLFLVARKLLSFPRGAMHGVRKEVH